MVSMKKELPAEFVDFIFDLIMSMSLDLEDEGNLKKLKMMAEIISKKENSKEFFIGYYTGLILFTVTLSFQSKYNRKIKEKELNEIIEIIKEKIPELEEAMEMKGIK